MENSGSYETNIEIINNEKGIVLKSAIKYFSVFLFVNLIFSTNLFAGNLSSSGEKSDSLKLLEKYSLFSEYFKNKDYASALPFGWEVLEMDPAKFSKWIYYKMEKSLWYIHDSTDVTPEEQKSLEDTTNYLYDLAIQYYPADKSYFESQKAFIMESWLHKPDEDVIKEYEQAIADNKNLSPYYYNRLGELYIKDATPENDYKEKAIDLYTYLQDREPDNDQWPRMLEQLVENIDQLVEIAKNRWLKDKDNPEKAWKLAQVAMKAGDYNTAIEALEFLISKAPETLNYWNQIASAYQKSGNLKKAEEAYLKLIELEPKTPEHYLNLGIVYGDEGKYALARKYYQKASEVKGGWGLAIYYEGYLYEKAARGCTFDFQSKLVYQLAVDTYRQAKKVDPGLQQAQERINALSTSVPTQEDYFFRGYKSGDSVPITGDCFGWIGSKSVTVP